jgi:DNA (cytosine-5)-methyltransferase 1
MKYSISLKNSSFDISKSLAKTLKKTKNKLSFKDETRGKRTVFIFKDFDLSFFKIRKTTSKTHFYILFLDKKYRVNKQLYDFLTFIDSEGCVSVNYNTSNIKPIGEKMVMVDLFSGTGASLSAGKKLPIRHCFSNDFCRNSKKIFEANFSGEFNTNSISNIEINTIPDHDILVAGFPCQPYSIAGAKQGLKDPRSDVFNDIIRFIKVKKPRFVVLENVKNLKSINRGEVLQHFLRLLHNTGYYTQVQLLNVSDIAGIPQNRERIFIFCFTKKSDFNSFDSNFSIIKNRHISEFIDTVVPQKYYIKNTSILFESFTKTVIKHVNSGTVYHYRRSKFRKFVNKVPTLTANMGTGGHNVPLIKDDFGVRKLTPRECFRLQGFPDNYKLVGSDSTLYKLVGNAINVKVLNLIFERFC